MPQPTVLTLHKRVPGGRGLAAVLLRRAATVELDWDTRSRSRFDATDSSGRTLGVVLPRGSQLRGGDVLVGADGSLARAEAINQWVQLTRETAEQRLQNEQAGPSMAQWLRQRDADDGAAPDPRIAALRGFAPAPTWPVAVALAAAGTGAVPRAALLAIAFGWAETMVQAAVKAVPLGQAAGQRVLATLAGEIPAAVDTALALDDARRQAFAPMLAILGAQHEVQYSRRFRS